MLSGDAVRVMVAILDEAAPPVNVTVTEPESSPVQATPVAVAHANV